jgi:hypothetical protein
MHNMEKQIEAAAVAAVLQIIFLVEDLHPMVVVVE